MTANLSPKMAELLADVRSGARRIYVHGGATGFVAYTRREDGVYWNGRGVNATAKALVARGLLVEEGTYLVAAAEKTPAETVEVAEDAPAVKRAHVEAPACRVCGGALARKNGQDVHASTMRAVSSTRYLHEATPADAPASADLVAETTPAEAPAEVPAETVATREAWLMGAVEALTPVFAEQGATLPAVRVSVGWPGGRGKKNAVIGQCWNSHASADKVPQVFISPVLDDAAQVLATLVHELVHAWDDCKSGHKGDFAKLAKRLGLEGKMTATVAGEVLKARLAEIAEALGVYPHARLSTGEGGAGEKKQTTRMLKVECADCGYTARTTKKWLEEVGAPLCPCNREEMVIA
ncbi:hypothetical protein ACFWDN_21375 [Micromonospora chalcea]